MSGILDWIKEHPYLTGGIALAVVILIVIWNNSQSSAAASSTGDQIVSGTSGGLYDATSGMYIPSDAVTSAGISAQQAVETAQIASNTQIDQLNAATNQAAIAAQVSEYQASVGGVNSQEQTEAGLTLGLVQAGQSAANTAGLIAAQPGAGPNAFQAYGLLASAAAAPVVPITPPPSGGGSLNGGSGGSGTGIATQPSPAASNCQYGLNPDGSCFVSTPNLPADPYGTSGLNTIANQVAQATPGGLTYDQASNAAEYAELESQGYTLDPNGGGWTLTPGNTVSDVGHPATAAGATGPTAATSAALGGGGTITVTGGIPIQTAAG